VQPKTAFGKSLRDYRRRRRSLPGCPLQSYITLSVCRIVFRSVQPRNMHSNPPFPANKSVLWIQLCIAMWRDSCRQHADSWTGIRQSSSQGYAAKSSRTTTGDRPAMSTVRQENLGLSNTTPLIALRARSQDVIE
jgi:hypothetical protein